jgi:hypothetical protein
MGLMCFRSTRWPFGPPGGVGGPRECPKVCGRGSQGRLITALPAPRARLPGCPCSAVARPDPGQRGQHRGRRRRGLVRPEQRGPGALDGLKVGLLQGRLDRGGQGHGPKAGRPAEAQALALPAELTALLALGAAALLTLGAAALLAFSAGGDGKLTKG